MKVYCYYLIDKKIIEKMSNAYLLESLSNISEDENNEYFFYAYTNNKKVAKRFERMRKSDKFARRVENLDEKEYEDLAKRCRGFQEIIDTPLLYKEHKHVVIPITVGERWYCVENTVETMMDYLDRMITIPPAIFNRNIIHLLGRIGYLNIRHHDAPVYVGYEEPCDLIISCGWRNEFSIFLVLYGDIVNADAAIESGIYE